MKCDKERITNWLNGELTATEVDKLEMHLSTCAACRQELESTRELFEAMENIPAPVPAGDLPARFQGMLDLYQESAAEKKLSWQGGIGRLFRNFFPKPIVQMAYTVIFLVIGYIIGYLLAGNGSTTKVQTNMAQLSAEVEEMKQMMTLALLENPSASERLRAVNYTEGIGNANKQVINALLITLNEDPNVNVRLATLEALLRYTGIPEVRQGLVNAIVVQESPLVQSALADVMLQLQEKNAVVSFKTLLNEKEISTPVREKIEQTIKKLTL